jgi:hypothetical protein
MNLDHLKGNLWPPLGRRPPILGRDHRLFASRLTYLCVASRVRPQPATRLEVGTVSVLCGKDGSVAALPRSLGSVLIYQFSLSL